MGFLLGTSADESLLSFDTINQDPNFDSGMNPERSINRTLQTYKFQEKAEFQYEFAFLQESKYRDLLDLLLKRNSLREGLLLLPIPYSEQSSKAILTPIYNTTSKAWYVETTGGGSNYPWGKNWTQILPSLTEFSSGDYGKILHYDSNYVAIPAGASKWRGFVFQFDLSDFITAFSSKEIRRLTLSYIGMDSSPLRFFIYSPTRAAWYLIDDRYYYDDTAFDTPPSGDGAFSLNKALNVGFGNPWGMNSLREEFIDGSNLVKIMVVGNMAQSAVVQYVRLFVNGYWVACQTPTSVDKFSVAFTGAGRSGSIKLLEV